MSTCDIVSDIVKPIAEKFGLDVWNIAFEKEGPNWFLRVYLDKKDSKVTVDDCEDVSRLLSDELDLIDPIEQSYYLEVSSAGLGRRLKKEEHFLRFIGSPISLKLYRALDGKKEFCGILKGFCDFKIELETHGEIIVIPFADCSYVKLDDDLDLFD
ncbi:MAG: ribosome maturation factor RimP [Oscillospiraceae bacterium]|nr:ribosome maturation factor RimP [Oscillospiraceae bacterium]